MRGKMRSTFAVFLFALLFVLTSGITAKATDGDNEGDKYNVTFVTNGGQFRDDSFEKTVTVDAGSAIGDAAVENPYDRDNSQVFIGWFKDSNLETPIENIEEYVPHGDENIYSGWRDVDVDNDLYVIFNANGGYFNGFLGIDNDYASGKWYVNSNVTFAEIGVPEGYKNYRSVGLPVVGWYFDAACTTRVPENYPITGEETFYAKYTDDYYVVTFDAGEGYFYHDENQKIIEDAVDKNAATNVSSLIFDGQMYTLDGKVISGWYLDEALTEPARIINGEYYPTSDVTLYAKWESGYKVTFDYGIAADQYEDYTQFYYSLKNRSLSFVPDLKGQSYEGYAFDGWYIDDQYSKELLNYYNYKVDQDITLYAKWSDKVTVTYDAGDGHFYNRTENTLTYDMPEGSTIPLYYAACSDEKGKTFVGWSLDGKNLLSDDIVTTQDVILKAVYTDGYCVTFDGNGQNIGVAYYKSGLNAIGCIDVNGPYYYMNVQKDKAISQNYYTEYAPMQIDKKEGFLGWSTTGARADIVDIKDFCITEDLTLYAVWNDADIYTVTFDANGGSFDDYSAERNYRIPAGTTVNYYLAPAKNGNQIFTAWNTEADGSGEIVDIDTYIVESDITFYAQYTEAYTVTYHANGGYFLNATGMRDMSTSVVPCGSETYLGRDSIANNDKDVAFSGWSISPDGSTVDVDGDTWYQPSSSIDLYAVWAKGNKVTFHANYESGAYYYYNGHTYTDLTFTIPKGKSINMYYYRPEYVNNDKLVVLRGYNTKADGSGETADCDFIPSGDIDLYAIHEDAIRVTYDANGGLVGYSYDMDSELDRTLSYTMPLHSCVYDDENLTYKREGYVFDYLSTDAAGKSPVQWDDGEYRPQKSVTLYVQWKKAVSVTFYANGGTIRYEGDKTTYTVGEGCTIQDLGSPTVTQKGQAVLSWNTQADGKGKDISEFTTVDKDMEFYAQWSEAYTVTVYTNGAEIYSISDYKNESGVYEIPVVKGHEVAIPCEDDWDNDLYFMGYYYDKDFRKVALENTVEQHYSEDNGMHFTPTEDTALYAKYDTGYTITFDGNGGYVEGEYAIMIDGVRKGFPLYWNYYASVKKGYHSSKGFLGWYTDPECTEDSFVGTKENIKNYYPTSDITLYAKFEKSNAEVKVSSVSLNKKKLSLGVSDTYELVSVVKPGNATNTAVSYESSDTDVATVDEDGVVTAVANGEATITVKTVDGEFTDTCDVTVEGIPAGAVKEQLENAIDNLQNADKDDAKQQVEEALSHMSVDKMADKTEANDEVAQKLKELDEAYQAAGNITVADTSEDDEAVDAITEAFGEDIDASKIGVSGLALSGEPDQTVKANFESVSADDQMPVSDEFNPIGEQIDIYPTAGDSEATANQEIEDLKAPVTITLPMPKKITSSKLYILHFNDDGTYELIKPTFKNNTMSFTVSHFSIFAFVELANGNVVENNDDDDNQEVAQNQNNNTQNNTQSNNQSVNNSGNKNGSGKSNNTNSNSGNKAASGNNAGATNNTNNNTGNNTTGNSNNNAPANNGNNNSENAPAENTADTNADAAETSVDNSNDVATAKIGTKATVGGVTYKISGESQVTYTAPKNKKAYSIKVPKTVNIDGKKYTVTAISKNAFKKCAKLKKVTIPDSVTKIESGAFSGCKNLKSITIKSTKITKIGKNAFKGISSEATIKVPKSKKADYTKLLNASKLPKGVKIK